MRLLYLPLLFCIPFINQAQTLCHPDYDALIAFYNATNGASWTNNTGWVDGAAGTDCDVCNWYGISCDLSGRVNRLALASNKLNGNIPSEIEDLSNLQSMVLNDNSLSGSIPPEIGNLDLLYLELNDNQLTGTIPSEIGNLSSLLGLEINNNQLTGSIPSQMGNLSILLSLKISNNQLTGSIPTTLGNLTSILALDFSDNDLSGSIPSSLGNLSPVDYISFSNNNLSECFPDNLLNLCAFTTDFSGNVNLPGGGDFATFCANGAGGCDAALNLKVMLGGAYETNAGMMQDALRVASLIPNEPGVNIPYSGLLVDIIGPDAIVDWVQVELRPTGNLTTVAVSRDFFVQRDGDIVDTAGNPLLYFWDIPAGEYQVAVRHRNHLGVLSQTTVTVD